jgi:hypothetical protein
MTLPASYPISMSQIANEVGLSLPVSLTHPFIEDLAQLNGWSSGKPISFSQLLGLTGRCDQNITPDFVGSPFNYWEIAFSALPFYGGTIQNVSVSGTGVGGPTIGAQVFINFVSGHGIGPQVTHNIKLVNNSTGVSLVFNTKVNGYEWSAASYPNNLFRPGISDNYSVLPSL